MDVDDVAEATAALSETGRVRDACRNISSSVFAKLVWVLAVGVVIAATVVVNAVVFIQLSHMGDLAVASECESRNAKVSHEIRMQVEDACMAQSNETLTMP